jgi:NitT/TauT family transport system substrate-binding protein
MTQNLLPRTLQYALPLLFLLFIEGCTNHSGSDKHETHATESLVEPHGGKPLTKVRFLPYWVVSAQFAGYYTGVDRSIYRKYGIDLEIVPFLPFVTSYDQMRDSTPTFAAIWLANAIELHANGIDIVNIAQPSTQSSLMLITKTKSNISTIQQMDGKRAGIWSGYDFQPNALFRKHNVDVTIVPIGSTNNLFLKDGVDITIANWFDEYHAITNTGLEPHEINTFFFKDLGLNFLEDGIYCLDSLRNADPEICKAFIMATFESWNYAFNHPEEAINIVLEYARAAKLPANRVHQRWMLDRYKDLYMPAGRNRINTHLNETDYATVGKLLLEHKVIDRLPPLNAFFKPVIIH